VTIKDEKDLAGYIDHTLLEATATTEQIKQLCEEAKTYEFHTVCVNSRWLPLVAEELHGSKVTVGGVVSLPLGADTTKIKVAAARQAVLDGADEIDMVADLAAIMEADAAYLANQLKSVADAAYLANQLKSVLKVCRAMRPAVTLKVIIESAALNREQKIFACRIANDCRVDFVKTSTGMNPAGGATAADVRLIKEHAPRCKVKAAGGIRTAKQVAEMIEAGAERIGTSAGIQIINELRTEQLQFANPTSKGFAVRCPCRL